jgi:hypothetical protein
MLAVALVASTASANVLLTAVQPTPGTPNLGPPGLNPGQTFTINIRIKAISAPLGFDPDSGDPIPQTVNTAQFNLSAGGGGTFVAPATTTTNIGVGGWVAFAPGPSQLFSGGLTSSAGIFNNSTTTRTLGSIVLQAGNTPGTFNVSFSNLQILDNDFQLIQGAQSTGLSYTVIPEPSSALLGGLALAGLAFRRRRS